MILPNTNTASATLIIAITMPNINVTEIPAELTKPLIIRGTRMKAKLEAIFTYEDVIALFAGKSFIIMLRASCKIPDVNNPIKNVLTNTMPDDFTMNSISMDIRAPIG